MSRFREFTFGYLIFIVILPVQILLAYLYKNNIGNNPMDLTSFVAVSSILVLVCLLFYGLTTTVSSKNITVSFGIGLTHKNIPLQKIKSIQIVESPWYYGWGIRLIPNGILYNISGQKGIELRFFDTDRVIRIGSKSPEVLKNEIEKRLT